MRGKRRNRLGPALASLAGAAVIVLFWLLINWLRPAPPRRVVMVTGAPGGDYGEVAGRYRAILARSGVDLHLVPTSGAMENLARLRDPNSDVDVGFLQGGTTNETESPNLLSLGTVFYEPLWFFVPRSFTGMTIASLRGRRISIGAEGSGGRALSLKLLGRIGVDERFAQLLAFPPQVAAAKLLDGEIDAATMMESLDSPVVKHLLNSGKVKLESFPHPDAYVALYPFLNKLVIPAGVGDILQNRPPEDAIVLAPKASLVVTKDLHPAIQYLLLDAAAQVNSGPGVFRKPGQFPAPESIDLPLSDEAVLYYKKGRPFLLRYFPFWLAVFVERLLVFLIPVVGVLYPVLTVVPTLNSWWFRRKVFRLYGELRYLEEQIDRGVAGDEAERISEFERLEQLSDRLKVPLSHAGLVYTLKEHIIMVRGKLARSVADSTPAAPPPDPPPAGSSEKS